MLFVFDFGNARGKFFVPRLNRHGDFRHAIAPLSENEWNNIVGRGRPPRGVIRVNGAPFALGDAAVRYTIAERPKGAARYKENYYGIGLAYALAEGIQRSDKNVFLYASHAPIDVNYARNLMQCAAREWYVECRYGELLFNVREVRTFDEPLGGYSHYVLTGQGDERKKNPLRDVMTLAVDVGGHTVDVVAIDPGGEIDLLSLHSTRTGVIRLLESFEADLRANNATLFQDTGDLDVRRVEQAIITGEYHFGRVVVPCANEAAGAVNALVNDTIQVINAAGGVGNFDYILLTGGGPALIYSTLEAALPRAQFILSEPDMELMKFSNVFGGAKLAALLRRVGA